MKFINKFTRKKSIAYLLILALIIPMIIPGFGGTAYAKAAENEVTEIESVSSISPTSVSGSAITVSGTPTTVTGSAITLNEHMSISLLKEDKTEIKNGDIVSLKDEFIITVFWDALGSDKEGDDYEVRPGDYFDLKLPEEFKIPDDYEAYKDEFYPDPSKVEPGFPVDKPFAISSIVKDGADAYLRITFQDIGNFEYEGFSFPALPLITDANIEFTCSLIENLTGDENGNVEIILGEASININVKELSPKAPELSKSVVSKNGKNISDNGETEWRVEYTHPTGNLDQPINLTDTIPEGMEFVEGSIGISVNGVDVTNTWSSFYSESGNVLTVDFGNNLNRGDKLILSYKTKLTDDTIHSLWQGTQITTLKNGIEARYATGIDKEPLKAGASVDASGWSGKTIIEKNGVPVDNNRKIQWTVIVKTGSRNFEEFYLVDTMGDGLKLTGGITITPSVDSERIILPTVDSNTIQIDFVKSSVPSTAESVYTITYTTEVDESYFDKTSGTVKNFNNTAELYYKFVGGPGIGVGTFTPPSVTKDPGINNDILRKRSNGSYNRQDQSLPWTITVNPN